MQLIYKKVIEYPKYVILLFVVLTVLFGSKLSDLRWETDARVYMPKGHPAIIYDEKIERLFGVKDALIIGIVNDEKTIFNTETLKRISRITEKISRLPGVEANRTIDVTSLSTYSVFVGSEESMGAEWVMPKVPESEHEIEVLKKMVNRHAELLVGNIVSADGSAAMIRAKIKEGADNRYQTYWQVKAILASEAGESNEWGGNEWSSSSNWPQNGWQNGDGDETGVVESRAVDNGDQFYLAGRPVIEVTSGLYAMEDMWRMIPLLLIVMAITLFMIFKSGRGVIIPLLVMSSAIVWTLGSMAWLDVPLYTISTMLPVILVAVGIGDSVHLLSNYFDRVIEDKDRESAGIVNDVLKNLGPPLLTTTITTGIGFLTLVFAEMPPFKVFALFTVLGILYCWILTITLAPALLVMMKPQVSGYLAKRRSIRLHSEQDIVSRFLVTLGAMLNAQRSVLLVGLLVLATISIVGATKLYVNSSWLSDFSDGSEVSLSTALLNERFDGTIFLNIVVESEHSEALKSPTLLKKIEELQAYVEELPYVGGSLSIVDYLKSMNKSLNGGLDEYELLPDDRETIGGYLYLYSVSGQPELLDEVIDYEYKRANITVSIQSDETRYLQTIIDSVNRYIENEFSDEDVTINLAGSANNSYIWANLLVDSQSVAIFLSKIGIFLISALLFRSLFIGGIVVAPVILTTLLVAGIMGVAGFAIDVSTALAAGVAIGVGVDYAVHYAFRYIDEQRRGEGHDAAVIATLRSVGRTIIFNSVIVAAGFSVLMTSRFPPHAKLGAVVSSYMLISCVIALVVLPLLLRVKRREEQCKSF